MKHTALCSFYVVKFLSIETINCLDTTRWCQKRSNQMKKRTERILKNKIRSTKMAAYAVAVVTLFATAIAWLSVPVYNMKVDMAIFGLAIIIAGPIVSLLIFRADVLQRRLDRIRGDYISIELGGKSRKARFNKWVLKMYLWSQKTDAYFDEPYLKVPASDLAFVLDTLNKYHEYFILKAVY